MAAGGWRLRCGYSWPGTAWHPRRRPEPGHRDYLGDAAVGVAAGMWDPFGTGHGWPEEQSGDDARSLTFTSEPLPGPLLVAGRPEAELYLTRPARAGRRSWRPGWPWSARTAARR